MPLLNFCTTSEAIHGAGQRPDNTLNQLIKTMSENTHNAPLDAPICSASSVDHAQIIRTWEDSLKDMQSRIRIEQRKANESTIRVAALQDEYWKLEGRLDVAKELVRKQSLPNDEAIHGGNGSPNSNWSATRRWMSWLVRFVVFEL